MIDHHHLTRALFEEGVENVLITVVADLSRLGRDEFWVFADNKGWCHPYDDQGVRRDFRAIPGSIAKLVDDPFRSLAGDCGGPAASLRKRRRSANSSGPTSCVDGSSGPRWSRISPPL